MQYAFNVEQKKQAATRIPNIDYCVYVVRSGELVGCQKVGWLVSGWQKVGGGLQGGLAVLVPHHQPGLSILDVLELLSLFLRQDQLPGLPDKTLTSNVEWSNVPQKFKLRTRENGILPAAGNAANNIDVYVRCLSRDSVLALRLLPGQPVRLPDVRVQVGHARAAVPAHRAHERLLSRVHPASPRHINR